MNLYDNYAEKVRDIAIEAGKIILKYNNNFIETCKADLSPITCADIKANEYIIKHLKKLTADINIISEENNYDYNLAIQKNDNIYWMIDPLDGTKSFIRKGKNYTVNIALIKDNIPIGGAVYAPFYDHCYYSYQNKAFKAYDNKIVEMIGFNDVNMSQINITSGIYHRQINELSRLYKIFGKKINFKAMASSIKFCLVAENIFDIYPRLGPTREWDIAASHAILKACGGEIYDCNFNIMSYGKKDFINSGFIATKSPKLLKLSKNFFN